MKFSLSYSRLLCFGLFLLVGTIVKSVQAETYVVALNHAPPYRIVSNAAAGPKFEGFYLEILKELAKREDLKLEFIEVPFKRALAMMENGQADIMVGPNRTLERERYMAYLNEEISRERKAFYVGKDGIPIKDYSALNSISIGVLRGSVYSDEFDHDSRLQKVETSKYELALNMVSKGRLDTVIIPELLGDYLIKENRYLLKKSSFFIKGRPSYIAISKKSSLILRKEHLELTLKQIKDDGSFQNIINRYTN